MGQHIAGLDIRNKKIVYALISQNRKNPDVEHVGIIPVLDGDHQTALRMLFDGLKSQIIWHTTDIISLFPSARVSTKKLDFPFVDKRKIKTAIPYSMEDYLPYAPDEAHFISTPISGEGDGRSILCWTVKQNELNETLSLFEAEEAEPKAIVPHPFVLNTISLSETANEKDEYLLGIYDSFSILMAKRGGNIINQRQIGIGLYDLFQVDQEISEETLHSIKTDIARQNFYQRTNGPSILNILDDFSREIVLSIRNVQTLFPDFDIENIRLFSEWQIHDETMAFWEEKIAVRMSQIQVTLPLLKFLVNKLSSLCEPLDIPQYMTALSLAFMGLDRKMLLQANLRQGTFIYQKDLSLLKGRFITSAALLAVIIVIALGTMFYRVSSQKSLYEQRKTELEEIFKNAFPGVKNVNAALAQTRQKVNEIKGELKRFGKEGNGDSGPLAVLNELSTVIPPEITIDIQEIFISDEKLEIRGEIDTYKSVDFVRSEIEKFPFVQEVQVGKTTKAVNSDVLVFQMTAIFGGSSGNE